MIVGWLAGGTIGVRLVDNERYLCGETDLGMAGCGWLIGWAVGMVHGAVVIGFTKRTEPSESTG